MELGGIRKEIDKIDAELLKLFERRMALAAQAASYKRAHGLPVLDAAREGDVVRRAESATQDEALRPLARRFFEEIMALSRHYQQGIGVSKETTQAFIGGGIGFLGPDGSFSHEAFLQAFGGGAKGVPFASFEEIVEAVASGACPKGLMPVENSLTGGIFAAADLLGSGLVHIIGETVLPVRHCLLAVPGASAAGIKAVFSHPQPLEQCRQYLRRRGMETVAFGSTTGAAKEVARLGDPSLAAIASEAAGRIYGLAVLEKDIQDNPANYTRFVLISAAGEEIPAANKISAIFVVEHRPGALYGLLRAFAEKGVNILNLVSRPVPGSPWQYSFHMDFDGSLQDENVKAALKGAGENCRSIILLGNYRKWES
jgi:chorismate mutase/prephenate dehydratase